MAGFIRCVRYRLAHAAMAVGLRAWNDGNRDRVLLRAGRGPGLGVDYARIDSHNGVVDSVLDGLPDLCDACGRLHRHLWCARRCGDSFVVAISVRPGAADWRRTEQRDRARGQPGTEDSAVRAAPLQSIRSAPCAP